MDALQTFGLQPYLFVAQVVNFLIIAYVLWRFLLKPMMTGLKLRKDKIAQGLADADRARRTLAEANREERRSWARHTRMRPGSWARRGRNRSG